MLYLWEIETFEGTQIRYKLRSAELVTVMFSTGTLKLKLSFPYRLPSFS